MTQRHLRKIDQGEGRWLLKRIHILRFLGRLFLCQQFPNIFKKQDSINHDTIKKQCTFYLFNFCHNIKSLFR